MAMVMASSSVTFCSPPVCSITTAICCRPTCSLLEPVVEVAVRHREPHAAERGAGHGSRQELTAHGGQHRVGEDGIHHPAPALHLGAPADDELHGLFIVGKRNSMVVPH